LTGFRSPACLSTKAPCKKEVPCLIDLHVHILPGLDDGPGSLDEALAMARCAYADGTSAVVATPHVITGLYPTNREKILAAVAHFNEILQENEITLSVLPGAEYRLEPDLPERQTRGELLTLNDAGRYLLVELPLSLIPGCTGRVIFELLLRGVVPVIAHPERNSSLAKDPSLLYDLVSRGALAQVTAGSITGMFGSAAASAARIFLEHGCAHFVASDAHSPHGRAPVLSSAAREAERLIGKANTQSVLIVNQRLAVKGEHIPTAGLKSIRPARNGLLRKLLPR